ncbi:efflux RND transporter periplasmic adaptor subunit [Parabacteroides bouchesdurhonensis]|uniref:efflux RND transporter periplasmic adaptor subunit n=1 Tax=Parabacteroides bouchesdurhonensis TaxID=1936995 RepID=UPI000E52A971|nr:efflux RND transporter periplasmic adaptor subunit [Parabacteroides bouchesdurhonensis]RHJ92425.1 efflux RND transporter periplasmic adaptor subunit [Bacteroides sp. AM07-16]
MDREISKEVQRKEQRKQLVKLIGGAVVACVLIGGIIAFMQTSLSRKDLSISTVDKGLIEVSVSASGKVVPAFEEIINSPINSRIIEIYKKGGDSVDVGTPILKLDLQSAETDYNKLLDEEQMKRLQLEQLRVTNRNKLSEMEMKLKVSRMTLNRKEVELRNERYLDSLGAGTTDKVRQTELDYNVSQLQLKEDEQKYKNEQALAEADLKVKELELNIFRKGLAETKRTLEDARIRSPRKAILTYVNNEVGAQVGQGTKVAIVSDLSHFKIEGEIADTYGDRIAAGSKAVVKIGSEKLEGTVSDVTPLSKNGVISFTVQLQEDNHKRLRSGLKTDVYVMNAVKEDVMRIANASYYVGRGEYELFVVKGDQLIKRKVQLGDSNFEYVEVVSGLEPGDEVVVSDISSYKEKNKLKLK